jgi:hypothetical protein
VISGTKNSITFCASGPSGTLQVGLVQKPPTSPEKVNYHVSFSCPRYDHKCLN